MKQRQTKEQKEIVDIENETKADKEAEGDRRQRKGDKGRQRHRWRS